MYLFIYYKIILLLMLFSEALEALKEISELACPNDGLLDQVRVSQDLLAGYELL